MERTAAIRIILGLFILLGIAFVLAGYLLSAKEKKMKKCCNSFVQGKILRYVFVHNAPAPIVEYTVEHRTYEKTRDYHAIIITNKRYRKDKGFFDTDYDIHVDENNTLHIDRGTNYILDLNTVGDKLWPIGSALTVYYNPSNPEEAFVDVIPQKENFLANVFIWTGIIFAVIGGLLAVLI